MRKKVAPGNSTCSRIIVTTQDIVSPIRGGGGLRTVGTAKSFRDRGYHVEILAPSDRTAIDGIPVKPLFELSKTGSQLLSSFLFVIQLFFSLLYRMRNVKLIFIHNSVAAIPSILVARFFKVPVILDVTDISTEYLYSSANNSPKKAILHLLLWVEYLTFKFADRLIVVSNVMADHLVQKGVNKNKIKVVYDGAEIEKMRTGGESDDEMNYSVIHHGGVDLRDGVIDIVDAAKIVIDEFPNATFYIIGDGSCLKDVIHRSKEKEVYDSFIFTGWQPYSKMKEYLSKADIGIVSRIDTLPNHMVLTLKLLEYWATDTAVISSKMKGILEVATDKEDILFYEPGNPNDLANKLLVLFKDQSLFQKIRKNGSETITKFNWPDLTSKIAELSL